jgi:hypothetical protein
MRVLNVGGGSRVLPPQFDGWEQDLLDIDSAVAPDICIDAKRIIDLPPYTYDAVWSSHQLEHVYQHEVPVVLEGFHHVLKARGFAWVSVPDIGAVVAALATKDISDTWYMAGENPITYHDVLYGWGKMIADGNTFYAHKTGFTAHTLDCAMKQFFPIVQIARDGFDLSALGIKCQ